MRSLNCPTRGHTMQSVGTQFRAAHFWREITLPDTGAFSSGTSSAINIRNPVLRMVHRILAHTVLARKENRLVTQLELFIIWAMLTSTQLDMNKILIKQVMRATHSTARTFVIEGMLTPLALSICPVVATWDVSPGPTLLDGRRMAAGRFITRPQPPFKFWQSKGDHFPLPYPALTHVGGRHNARNWLMNTAAHRRAIGGEEGVEHDGAGEDEEMEQEVGDEEEEEAEPAAPGAHIDLNELIERMQQLQASTDSMMATQQDHGAQLNVMRTDVTAIRLQQQAMDAYMREEAERQRAWQEEYMRQFQDFQSRFGGPPPS